MAGAYSLAAQAPAPDVAGEEGPQPRGPAFELSISPVALAQDEVVDCAAVLDPGIDNEREWRPLSSNVLDLGFSEQAYWLRLSFPRAAHDPGAVDRFIVFQQQMLEEALYCDPGTGMQFAGTRIPFHEWPQKLRFPAFRLKTGQPAYFFRIQSERILNFPVRVFFSLEGYLDYIQTRQIAQFGLLGVAALAGLFYFGWFIASGRNLYLYFSALMFSVTLNFFIVYGDAYMYFWPDSPELQNTAVKFTTAVAALFAAMFSRPLLNSRELPRLDAGIKIVIAAQVVSIVCALVPAFEAINRFIMFASPFAALPLVFPAAWIQLRRGHLPATLYLAGWLIVLIAFLLN
ncbi:MAG: 7TM diverse intracellular signaling domain-containing protein, partial [Leptospirales bacterium]